MDMNNMFNMEDTTTEYDQQDIQDNKVMAIFAYIGILVLIPIFAAPNSKFARFHSNQGLLLCIACVAYSIVYAVLSGIILAISIFLAPLVAVLGLVELVFLALMIIGIVNVAQGKAKELPVIGKFRILK